MILADLGRFTRPELEALIEAALHRLDVLDGDPDREPDADREPDPEEGMLQPLTLCPDRVAMRRGRRSRDPSVPAPFRTLDEVMEDVVADLAARTGRGNGGG